MAKTVIPLPIPVAQVMADADTLGRFIRAARTQSGMGIVTFRINLETVCKR